MEYIDLRKLNKGELKQVRSQVVRFRKRGTPVSGGNTSASDSGGTGGNTRNDYHAPSRGIRYSRQFVDVEESVRIHLEKVSEKDIRR